MRLYFWGDFGAAIANLNHDVVIVAEDPESQFSLTEHRFDRVFDDVGPNLIQFCTHGIN